MCSLTDDIIPIITAKTSLPIILRGYISNWPLCNWNLDMWCTVFGNREIPFRSLKKNYISDEPCWERKCNIRNMTFTDFTLKAATSEDWMYFDYKYLHQWFSSDDEIFKEISWKSFGFPDKGAADTTLWVGSAGSHTPAHQDTYGVNIIAQLYGRKRWLLFPPETTCMKPTRVPYEESSVYSELNFYCPSNLEAFQGLTGGLVAELAPGDALILPRGWWHYVQNMEPINISVNVWLPHEKDVSTRVSEAIIKIFIAQICKDLPNETRKQLLNPNEDDISDTPLAVLFLELETVTKVCLDTRRKTRRAKRQKTRDEDSIAQTIDDIDLKGLLDNKSNRLESPKPITGEGIVDMLKNNLLEFANVNRPLDDDEVDGMTANLCLTKALIDSFSDNSVIEKVKQNLFARLS